MSQEQKPRLGSSIKHLCKNVFYFLNKKAFLTLFLFLQRFFLFKLTTVTCQLANYALETFTERYDAKLCGE